MSVFLIHPGNSALIAFDAGELAPPRHARVARHLRGCVRCQESLRFIRQLDATAREIDAPSGGEALLSRILADRHAGERVLLPATGVLKAKRPRSAPRVLASLAAAAAIAIVLILSVSPEGLSAASGRLMHNLMHRVAPLSALVDVKHADSIARNAKTVPKPLSNAIPVYSMGEIEAEASERLKSISTVKVFSNGTALVHDASGRSLRLYDSTLSSSTLIAGIDGGNFRYGTQISILVPYWGDSALFLDNASRAFIVLDASGSVKRTIALPIGTDALAILSGQPALDPMGRLYYRRPIALPRPGAEPTPFPVVNADSSALVRADFETRSIDTVAFIASGGVTRTPTKLASGQLIVHAVGNPTPINDDWAILADGTLAIVRGQDYHIDWIRADGSRAMSGKLPFDWRKLDAVAKQQILDSAQAAIESTLARSASAPTKIQMRDHFEFVGIDRIPDYFPPLRVGSRRADLDGNVWIPPSTTRYPTGGGLLYDAVNQQGRISRRVLLKPGYSVAGFGSNGAIYMIASDSTGLRLARARVARHPLPPK